MNFFISLKENATLNQFKADIISNIHSIQNLIEIYLEDEDLSEDILASIMNSLNVIINKLNSLGYTYSPEVLPNVSEEEFRNILDKFKIELSNLYNNLSKDGIESFNTQIGYLYNLIEVHKVGNETKISQDILYNIKESDSSIFDNGEVHLEFPFYALYVIPHYMGTNFSYSSDEGWYCGMTKNKSQDAYFPAIARRYDEDLIDSSLNYIKKFTSEKRAQNTADKIIDHNIEYEYKVYYIQDINDLRRK